MYICMYVCMYVCKFTPHAVLDTSGSLGNKFERLVFVTLGFESQIPLLRAIFHGFGTQTQGYKQLQR